MKMSTNLTLKTSIDIGAPLDRIWSVLTNYAAYHNWNPYIVRIEGEAVAGETVIVHSMSSALGQLTQAPVLVVAIDPFTMRWEGGLADRGKFKGDHWFVVTPTANGSHLAHFEHFSGTLAQVILDQHGDAIARDFVLFNNALKAEAERLAAS
jgi:hypothetical protein